jgi:cold-inducible RNA-binding protein
VKLFVGNLPPAYRDRDLQELFSKFGVLSAKVIMDRETNRSKGFGFVELENREVGQQAISEMDKKMVGSAQIVVNEARPQENRSGRDNRERRDFNAPFKKRG